VPVDSPAAKLNARDFHGYEFGGLAGGVVTITETASSCGDPDTFVYLFGPEDTSGNRGADLIHNDDAGDPACPLNSRIQSFRLPVTGGYLILASSFLEEGGRGTYGLSLTCENGACEPPGEMNFARSRIAQVDIDSGALTVARLFDVGDFLFEHNYSV